MLPRSPEHLGYILGRLLISVGSRISPEYGPNQEFKNLAIAQFEQVLDQVLTHLERNGVDIYGQELIRMVLSDFSSQEKQALLDFIQVQRNPSMRRFKVMAESIPSQYQDARMKAKIRRILLGKVGVVPLYATIIGSIEGRRDNTTRPLLDEVSLIGKTEVLNMEQEVWSQMFIFWDRTKVDFEMIKARLDADDQLEIHESDGQDPPHFTITYLSSFKKPRSITFKEFFLVEIRNEFGSSEQCLVALGTNLRANEDKDISGKRSRVRQGHEQDYASPLPAPAY